MIRGGVDAEGPHPDAGRRNTTPPAPASRFFGDSLDPESGAEAFANTAKSAINSYQNSRGALEQLQPALLRRTGLRSRQQRDETEKGRHRNSSASTPRRAPTAAGRPSARWTLLAPLNAEFSPMASQDASPTIQYTVSNTPSRRSGQGHGQSHLDRRGRRRRPGRSRSSRRRSISTGNFSGELTAETPASKIASVQNWTGVVKFNLLAGGPGGAPDGLYTIESGMSSDRHLGASTQSGITRLPAVGLGRQGPLTGGAAWTVTGTGRKTGRPTNTRIELAMPFMAEHGTRVAPCPKQAQEEGFEGTDPRSRTCLDKLSVRGQDVRRRDHLHRHRRSKASVRAYIQNWNLHAAE